VEGRQVVLFGENMYYGEDVVAEVRSRNDIVDVVSGYVKLKKQGANYFGLCPFHNEKSASFSVSPSKQICYCFGCGKGGDSIRFVELYENVSFGEAVEMLAAKAGYELPKQEMSYEQKREQSIRSKILEVNKEAAKFYYSFLRSEPGRLGLEYFNSRQLTKETMQSFGLGYSGMSNSLYNYLKSKGYEDSVILESGLAVHDEKRGIHDKFWNRVMFPIMDLQNRVIAFGGRVMGDGKPKYLNSPETKVFDKGRTLYGLNIAKNEGKKKGHIIICEGYMDVISMHQAGFTEAVATLGTAVTAGHASLLKKYTTDMLLLYDSDMAGRAATERAITRCREVGLSARVVNLEPYKDPDEFIKNLGAAEFQKRLDNSENSFYYLLRMAESNYNMSDPDGRTRFLEQAADMLSHMENELERTTYIQGVASKYSTDPAILASLVAKMAAKNEGIVASVKPRSGISERNSQAANEDGSLKVQRLLLTSLVENPEIFTQISKYIAAEDFEAGVNRKVAAALFKQLETGELDPAAIMDIFEDGEDKDMVARLFNSKYGDIETKSDREKYITDLVVKMKMHLMDAAKDNAADGQDPLKMALEQRKLKDELKKLRITL